MAPFHSRDPVSSARAAVIARVADDLLLLPGTRIRRAAVDGVDGAGKTYFAQELAKELSSRGATVIRASVDGFLNPREIRHRLGRSSPEGFFRDSYGYDKLISLLLEPLGPGGTGRYVRRVYDIANETPVPLVVERASPASILVIDGIFLHRDELTAFWDYSVWLDVPFGVSIPRGAQRGLGDADPHAASNRRYVEGQRLYLSECRPQLRATIVIDNEDLHRPVIRGASTA